MPSKVEPRLQKALSVLEAPDELLDVVVRFDVGAVPPVDASLPLLEQRHRRAAAVSDAVEKVLARAGKAAGTEPTSVTPFPLTGSAYVQAPRRYLQALLEQREVTGATFNSGESVSHSGPVDG